MMIVAAVVVDKLAILHLLEQAEYQRSSGHALAIMPDGSTHVNADPHIQGYPLKARFTLTVGSAWMTFECERTELASHSRRAFVYHLAEADVARWQAADFIERQRRATEVASADEGGPAGPQGADGPERRDARDEVDMSADYGFGYDWAGLNKR